MKKITALPVLVMLIVLATESPGDARHIEVGIKVGYLFLSGTGSFFDALEETTRNDPFFEDAGVVKFNGFSTEVETIWNVRPGLQISGTVGFFRKSLDLGFRSPSFSLTDTYTLTAFPILGSVKYRWMGDTTRPASPIVPYVGGGVSIYPFVLELDDQTLGINQVLFLTPDILTETLSNGGVGLGVHVLGGIEIVIHPRISLLVEDRFTFFGETELEEFNDQSIGLSGNQVNGGILFKF